jgi:protocatechuate 3,4-dioxygenase beta subunit
MYVLRTTLGVLLFSLALSAQDGRILGTVTDQTGAVLAGATVSVIDTQRGLARTQTTDAAGEYNAPTLNPGTYTVRVAAKGWRRWTSRLRCLSFAKSGSGLTIRFGL